MAADPLFAAGERLPAAKLAQLSPDPVSFTPVWTSVTLGTGGTSTGFYWYTGRMVNYVMEFILGTGGDVTGTIEVDYPTTADAATATLLVARAWAGLGNPRWSGSAVGGVDGLTRFVSENTSAGWAASTPFNWAASAVLRVQGSYIEA